MEHSREGAKADEYCQEPQHLELPEGKPAAKPQGGQGSGEGEGGDVEAGFDPAYQDKPPQAQDEVKQMGQGKAEKIAGKSIFWKKKVQKTYIQGICEDIIPDTPGLLAQTLGHAVGDGIAVEHGHKKAECFQLARNLHPGIEGLTQRVCHKEQNPAADQPEEQAHPEVSADEIADPPVAS